MSASPRGGKKYGVQVGNETYSLILTQEDWEKRRQDHENARKLSLANNKRRKALDDRKRVAEARENRKRELELFKRRQRQIEATERYQRFHINVKDKRTPNSDFVQGIPNLEEVLQKLRGGDGDSSVGNVQSGEKPSASDVTEVKTNPEEDQPGQPVTMERAQWQNMKEYAEDIRRQILSLQSTDNELKDSLEVSQDENLVDDDGQDSLHGSSISGSSQPSYSSLSLSKGNADTVNNPEQYYHKPENLFIPDSGVTGPPMSSVAETSLADTFTAAELNEGSVPSGNSDQQQNVAIIRGTDTGVLCKRDSQTGRITYYVKAYRPWSASMMNKPFQSTYSNANDISQSSLRPSSSYVSTRKSQSLEYTAASPKIPQRHYDTWITTTASSGYITQHSNKFSEVGNEGKLQLPPSPPKSLKFSEYSAPPRTKPAETQRASSAPLGRTTATPVSTYYGNTPPKSSTIVIPGPPALLPATVVHNFEYSTQPVIADTEKRKPPSTIVTYSSDVTVPISSDTVSSVSEKISKDNIEQPMAEKKQLKGILRRYSKYDTSSLARFAPSHPPYQSAGLARQKWLHGINYGPPHVDATDPERELRVRSAEPKSVRWHQIQYNDGTTSALDVHESPPLETPVQVPKPQPPPRAAPRVRTPKKPLSRPKSSPARSTRGGKVKAGGRRLRPAKEVHVNIVPHPPRKQSPKLSMSTVINYSIDPEENMPPKMENKSNEFTSTKNPIPRPSSGNKRISPMITHNRIYFHRKGKHDSGEAVTMSTLKSRGNDPRLFGGRDFENAVVNQGNQVTINVSSSKPVTSVANTLRRNSDPSRIPLNGTPTDQEIEMLWDKVRAYLAWNRNRGNSPIVKKMRSAPERKIAWSSTQPELPSKRISANIISIDGGIFGKNSTPEEIATMHHQTYKPHQMPVHYERFGIAKNRKAPYSPTVQAQDFGLCPSHGMQFQMKEKIRGTVPVMSNGHPSSAPVRRQPRLTDSVKTFRLVEALIEQNVPEEEILKALNSLQSATRDV